LLSPYSSVLQSCCLKMPPLSWQLKWPGGTAKLPLDLSQRPLYNPFLCREVRVGWKRFSPYVVRNSELVFLPLSDSDNSAFLTIRTFGHGRPCAEDCVTFSRESFNRTPFEGSFVSFLDVDTLLVCEEELMEMRAVASELSLSFFPPRLSPPRRFPPSRNPSRKHLQASCRLDPFFLTEALQLFAFFHSSFPHFLPFLTS